MASPHVTCDRLPQNENCRCRVLVNNNSVYDFDHDIYSCLKKYKCSISSCSCICKENITEYYHNRKRSKSESCKFHCVSKYNVDSYRIKTSNFNHIKCKPDKVMNLYMMPENVQELFLGEYRMKDDLNWQSNNDKQLLITQENNDKDPKMPHINCICISKNGVINNNKNNIAADHELEISKQLEPIVGSKRSRNKSPNIFNGNEMVISTDDIPCKITPKRMLETDYFIDSYSNLPFQPSSRHSYAEVRPVGINHYNTTNNSETSVTFLNGNESQHWNLCENRDKFERLEIVKESNGCSNSILKGEVSSLPEFINENCVLKNEIDRNYLENLKESEQTINTFTLHSRLRPSLFPNVPPYIKFSSFESKGEPFPIHIHKLLRWKLSNITPLIVRKVVSNSGYRLLKKSIAWGGTWGKHTKSSGFKTLYDFQKINHFPGTFQIGRKDRLWKCLQKFMLKYEKCEFDFMPTTYVLPHDKKLLRIAWKKNHDKEPWIIKPPASARGTGIKVVSRWNQIPDNVPIIVQRYISNPYLINNTKFDLRLYVLVTSINPLRIYLYDNGLVRFASMKYSTEANTLDDRYMHLTNYSINKLSSKYEQNENVHSCQGHKWTLKALWNYLNKERNVNSEQLWTRLIDLVIKTIISGENSISQLTNANLPSRYNSYELFGIDVLFDEELKPWLLEVNISPSIHSASTLDLAVKAPMVQDLMNIVGFQIPRSKKFSDVELCKELGAETNMRLCYDKRLYTRIMSSSEKLKHHTFCYKSREEYLDNILDDLTPDDVRHLIQYEDEITQLGSFQKIFPTDKTYEYLQYFETPKYYNLLFDAWETKYHSNRNEGIQLLCNRCEAGVHLRISKASTMKIYKIHQKCQQEQRKFQQNKNNSYKLRRREHKRRNVKAAAIAFRNLVGKCRYHSCKFIHRCRRRFRIRPQMYSIRL